MNASINKFWQAAYQMVDSFFARLPSLIVGVIVFLLFYVLSIFVSRVILRTTRHHRPNLGVVFARLIGAAIILLGFLVAFSVVAPSFQAGDLIKILGIGGVAIGFAFQNILQNFLAGLLLLWAEPFRIRDEIKLDNYEGTVEDIQTRATIIRTYDGRRVVIPNADLFTHSVTVNTALDIRRWEYDLSAKNVGELADLKSLVTNTVSKVPGVLPSPGPEVLVMDLGDPNANIVKMRVFWWTKAPRQHEMLASYDKVLTAIDQTLNPSAVAQPRAA
ncbi:MAG: mechanosensitive ion channel family protein [Acidobacteriia bacterium]|nr:mechanosensitive ion channel family protein [Terriglobia bacterium]